MKTRKSLADQRKKTYEMAHGESAAKQALADALNISVWANSDLLSNWWTLLLSQKLAYGQSAAYSYETNWLSKQVCGTEDRAEHRAEHVLGSGSPHSASPPPSA